MLTTDHLSITSRLESLADYKHGARNKRAGRILSQMLCRPSASIPVMMEDRHQAKRCYAFLRHPMVKPEATQEAAFKITAERCVGVPQVLLIGDDTQLDLTTHSATGGLGPMGDGGGRGLCVHGLLAVRADSHEVLGPADLQVWAREEKSTPSRKESTYQRRNRDRESGVWEGSVARALPRLRKEQPEVGATHWILVGDCGADIFSYLSECLNAKVGFVQRAYQDRPVRGKDGASEGNLLAVAARAPIMTRTTIEVPAAPGRPKRTASLQVRARTVTLAAPHAERVWKAPLTVHVVRVGEVDAPAGVKPLEWLLLTTEPIATAEQVLAVVSHYRARWLIEEWHFGLKTGCGVEDRQLKSRHAVENFLSFAMVVACELLRLRDAARRHPEQPATVWLRPMQLEVLRLRRPRLPLDCTLHDAVRAIGQLGGFMGTSKKTPGWRLLWVGFQALLDAERAFVAGIRHHQRESLRRARKESGAR